MTYFRFLLFSLVLFLLWPGISAQEESRIDTLLSEADRSIAGNDLPAALARTQEALRISENSIPALLKQINIYFLMHNDKDAMRYAEEALNMHPEEPDFYYMRGILNNSKEKFGRALNDFNKGLELKPVINIYKYYLGRGIAHYNLVDYDLALSDLTSAIEMNDTLASAYHSRALVNYDMHDYSAAVDDFLKALNYSNGNSALYFNLGMSYFRLNEKDKACPYFHKSCTMGNNNACRMALMECAREIPLSR